MKKKAVVYKIVSKINGLEYVGSTKDWVMRKSKHISLLKKDKHPNNLLQGVFNKHGLDNFDFIVIEDVSDINTLSDREQHYMDELSPEMNIQREAYSSKKREVGKIKDDVIDKRIGNQFWKLRSKHGRDKIFATPEIMMKACYEYFEYQSQQVWNKTEYKGKDIEKVLIPISSPFTLTGLCIFLGVNTVYFTRFEKGLDEKTEIGKDFSQVITHVREVIRTQKLEGATVGVYNSNIVARLLGLADKKETKLDASVNIPIKDWILKQSKDN